MERRIGYSLVLLYGLVVLLFAAPMLARWGEGGPAFPVAPAEEGGTLWTTTLVEDDDAGDPPTQIDELLFPVEAGHAYRMTCRLSAYAAATGTAIRFSVTGPAATDVDFTTISWTASVGISQTAYNAFGFVQSTITQSNGTTSRIYEIQGLFIPSAAGVVAVTVDSEVVASTVSVEAGSYCEYYYHE